MPKLYKRGKNWWTKRGLLRRVNEKYGGRRGRRGTIKGMVGNKEFVNMGLGFPKKLIMTHRYVDAPVGTSTTGVPFNYRYSCNGMFDPNITGSGHQPYYFDQLTTLYDHYCVVASKCVVKMTPVAALTIPATIGGYINDDTSTIVNTTTLCELSLGKHRTINNQSNVGNCTFSLNWSAKKYFGKNVLANDELQGTVATNPTEQSYYNLFAFALDGGSTLQFFLEVQITYIAVWKELIDITGS